MTDYQNLIERAEAYQADPFRESGRQLFQDMLDGLKDAAKDIEAMGRLLRNPKSVATLSAADYENAIEVQI